ncbi:hypothetical protein ABNX05_14860 [Lysinibacillus sp. M3]|uniref:Tail fiber protein n=1 Tax=Lysinibacillus zambalensis TaxID=3160866 RepID=A0ABV1MXD9_9BACI
MAVQTGSTTTFYPDIRLIEPTDPGHADTFNLLFKVLIDNDAFLKLTKADLSYVNTELAKKITPSEVDTRIKALIGAAPAALDTLYELAAALNNDPNFAATITNELAKKVDKVSGKQLSTEDYTSVEKTKLAGIATGANNYTHPANHPPSIITQDANNRFVTDAQIAAWTAKQGDIGFAPAQMVSGTYTGDAKANRAINVGFQPKYVKVIGNGVTFEAYPTLSQLTPQAQLMDGTNYSLNDAVNFGAITATGFTCGSSTASKANTTGQTYTYIAMG